jgi:glycogen(starch) synthase
MLVYYLAVRDRLRVPSIYVLFSNYDWIWDPRFVARRTIADSDFVVSCSDVLLQGAVAKIPEIASRSATILSGLPMPAVPPAPLPWNPPTFLCLGQLMAHKGFDTALCAFGRIAERFPAARMVVSGDGDARSALVELADTLGLRDRVTFTGWVTPEEVPAAINRATAVVMPSLLEGLPQVGMQAAQMGRPLLGSNVDGLLEVVAHGDTGLLTAPRDDVALAGSMTTLLSDPEGAAAMGHAARRRAEAMFDWDRHVREFDSVIRRMAP